MTKKNKKRQKRTLKSKNKSRSIEHLSFLYNVKQVMMTFFSILLITSLFLIPTYKNWLKQRIIPYFRMVPTQMKTMDVEKRIINRHGYNYIIPQFVYNNTPDSAIILLPPKSYVKNNYSDTFFRWHHAAWNYYFFGKNKYINFSHKRTQNYSKPTHALLCDKKKLSIIKVDSPDKLNNIIATYNRFENNKLALKE